VTTHTAGTPQRRGNGKKNRQYGGRLVKSLQSYPIGNATRQGSTQVT